MKHDPRLADDDLAFQTVIEWPRKNSILENERKAGFRFFAGLLIAAPLCLAFYVGLFFLIL